MTRKLPSIALLLGIGGLIPFVVCSLGALANPPPNDALSLLALIAYGAVILAFLGRGALGVRVGGARARRPAGGAAGAVRVGGGAVVDRVGGAVVGGSWGYGRVAL